MVRNTVPALPATQATDPLTADSPRNCAVVPVSVSRQPSRPIEAGVVEPKPAAVEPEPTKSDPELSEPEPAEVPFVTELTFGSAAESVPVAETGTAAVAAAGRPTAAPVSAASPSEVIDNLRLIVMPGELTRPGKRVARH
ncbi:hypothetical protein ACTOB_007309 [Actinoplanes oblitus]|uniref:Uncharacterized protein n=1 Tax=Actinoplanes oblitus TaxID=3040509 RepID=A0ABY8WCK6_9ACTN|nr:hypothetical protein [Actinoplanes oblitus]WIM95227.1 hypothetical protein ACTOB_007309 [Actinoplanes oblitus]